MFKEKCAVLENKAVAPGHFVLKLRSKKIGVSAKPGQFVQVLCGEDPLEPFLPRPFSFLSASASHISLLYHVVGKGTELMSKFEKGDEIPVIGPLGNGFTISSETAYLPDRQGTRLPAGQAGSPEKKVLVGGGVGIPPLYHLVETWLKKTRNQKKEDIHVLLGARDKSLLLCEKEFRKLGVNLSIATNDGSKGTKGFVTSLLTKLLQTPSFQLRARIYSCGPTPMLKAVSNIASEFDVGCETSVEVPMACGFGACLGCAIKVRVGARHAAPQQHYRYAIACTEGPVFDGRKVLWD